MATTGTYNFNPSAGDLTINAFARIGIRRTEITQQHLSDAAAEANLVQVSISNRLPNLWLAETYDVPLVAGTKTYVLPSRLISPMAVWMTVTPSGGSPYDRILMPISTFEYEAMPNKDSQSIPTTYWLDRLTTPQVTMWPVPNDNATYVLHLRMISQPQDVALANGRNINMPYRWLDFFAASLAHRLSRIYAPTMETQRRQDAKDAWAEAATEDIEYVPLFVLPGVSGYYR